MVKHIAASAALHNRARFETVAADHALVFHVAEAEHHTRRQRGDGAIGKMKERRFIHNDLVALYI